MVSSVNEIGRSDVMFDQFSRVFGLSVKGLFLMDVKSFWMLFWVVGKVKRWHDR